MSLKQIIQIKHYMVKNRFGSEVNQLAIYKRLRIWTGDYREQIQLAAARAGLELGDSRLHVQCSKPLGHAASDLQQQIFPHYNGTKPELYKRYI